MKLKAVKKQFPLLHLQGDGEIVISGLSANSKAIRPGDLFIAKKRTFISEAIQNGAAAILSEAFDSYCPVPQLIYPEIKQLEPDLAAYFYGNPSHQLKVIGITGTCGKTSSAYLIKHLLDHLAMPCGLIGTIETIIKDERRKATLTTPDVVTNQKLLSEMVQADLKACAMEVSSHGLDQGRVDKIRFSVAHFTNLSQDHLDYHHSMEAYATAKRKLFENLDEDAVAIVNRDDPLEKTFYHPLRFTYGLLPGADLIARDLDLSERGIAFTAEFQGRQTRVTSPLVGRFNVYNLLGAIMTGIALGLPLDRSAQSLATFQNVPGRMTRVKNDLGIHLFVDYSHKPDALAKALLTLREFKSGRVIVVFGCGGDRDQDKRPKMGRIASELADLVFITNDNPRSEDPALIAKSILAGCTRPATLILDRKEAIETAIGQARAGDLVLIAGKGHENYQIFADETIHFDDLEIAQGALQCVS